VTTSSSVLAARPRRARIELLQHRDVGVEQVVEAEIELPTLLELRVHEEGRDARAETVLREREHLDATPTAPRARS
jgi:hypothetical protein